jgi:ABC-type antimicrobial peptide transport system permease subunit
MHQRYVRTITILARTTGGRRIASELRALVTTMDPKLPVLSAIALEDEAGPVVTQLRIAAAASGSLGIVGYLLAAIGIYGVTANMVTQRTREIGVRIVLGAAPADLVRMVFGEGMRLVVIGSAVGLLLASISSTLLVNLLFGVPRIDPATFGGTVALFAAVGLAACYVPVVRAIRTDPIAALRYE